MPHPMTNRHADTFVSPHRASVGGPSRPRTAWVWVAMLAMLCAQWLASSHSVVHADLRGAVHAEWSLDAQGRGHGHGQLHGQDQAAHDSAGEAWSHAAGSVDCQLIDHLLVGQAPGGSGTPGAVCLAPEHTALWPDLALGHQALLAFEARAPPRG